MFCINCLHLYMYEFLQICANLCLLIHMYVFKAQGLNEYRRFKLSFAMTVYASCLQPAKLKLLVVFIA
jgi:hypothetical protein